VQRDCAAFSPCDAIKPGSAEAAILAGKVEGVKAVGRGAANR
jgi:hypothetical protein